MLKNMLRLRFHFPFALSQGAWYSLPLTSATNVMQNITHSGLLSVFYQRQVCRCFHSEGFKFPFDFSPSLTHHGLETRAWQAAPCTRRSPGQSLRKGRCKSAASSTSEEGSGSPSDSFRIQKIFHVFWPILHADYHFVMEMSVTLPHSSFITLCLSNSMQYILD